MRNFDTGVLLKLYLPELRAAEAVDIVSASPGTGRAPTRTNWKCAPPCGRKQAAANCLIRNVTHWSLKSKPISPLDCMGG